MWTCLQTDTSWLAVVLSLSLLQLFYFVSSLKKNDELFWIETNLFELAIKYQHNANNHTVILVMSLLLREDQTKQCAMFFLCSKVNLKRQRNIFWGKKIPQRGFSAVLRILIWIHLFVLLKLKVLSSDRLCKKNTYNRVKRHQNTS